VTATLIRLTLPAHPPECSLRTRRHSHLLVEGRIVNESISGKFTAHSVCPPYFTKEAAHVTLCASDETHAPPSRRSVHTLQVILTPGPCDPALFSVSCLGATYAITFAAARAGRHNLTVSYNAQPVGFSTAPGQLTVVAGPLNVAACGVVAWPEDGESAGTTVTMLVAGYDGVGRGLGRVVATPLAIVLARCHFPVSGRWTLVSSLFACPLPRLSQYFNFVPCEPTRAAALLDLRVALTPGPVRPGSLVARCNATTSGPLFAISFACNVAGTHTLTLTNGAGTSSGAVFPGGWHVTPARAQAAQSSVDAWPEVAVRAGDAATVTVTLRDEVCEVGDMGGVRTCIRQEKGRRGQWEMAAILRPPKTKASMLFVGSSLHWSVSPGKRALAV